MVKKVSPGARAAPAAGLLDSQLAQAIKDSAQQIWLAGLGAFAKAQSEGNRFFEHLIKEGTSLHRKSQTAAGEHLGEVAGKMSAMAEEVGQRANSHWDKLESIFEQRTSRALGRLGVPSAAQLAALEARIAALEARGEKGASGPAAKAARPARKSGAAAKRRTASKT